MKEKIDAKEKMKFEHIKKQKRAFTGIAKTETMLLKINEEAYKLLCYEKTKQKSEDKTNFVF